MDSGEFLKGSEASRVIARASRVARMAVSVFLYDGTESSKQAGCGACAEACAFVHTLPWGHTVAAEAGCTEAKGRAAARAAPASSKERFLTGTSIAK